jgi:D-glycero-alpha-D-manno-heptose 1-phosphate guanylyltransferase
MKKISAAILAGGLGTRLRPALGGAPKVLAPVGHRPFITILLGQLDAAGIEKAVLLTGYRSADVRQTLGNRYAGLTLIYSAEATPLGTAGALRQALPLLETETILLLNGDSFCAVDLSSLAAEHKRRRAEMTLTLAHVPDAGRFGQVKLAHNGKVTCFMEKQTGGNAGWINAGVYVVEKSLVEAIPPRQAVSLERNLLPSWVETRRVYGFLGADRFLDIGTPSSYAAAADFFR